MVSVIITRGLQFVVLPQLLAAMRQAEQSEPSVRDWTGFALGSQSFRIEDEKNGFKNSFEQRFVRTHGTRTARDRTRIRASAGRQLKTFE